MIYHNYNNHNYNNHNNNDFINNNNDNNYDNDNNNQHHNNHNSVIAIIITHNDIKHYEPVLEDTQGPKVPT